MIFVYFTNAFNTVNKEVVWNIQEKLGCPDKLVKLVSVLPTEMKASFSLRIYNSREVENRALL